jgi:hypothetical protein
VHPCIEREVKPKELASLQALKEDTPENVDVTARQQRSVIAAANDAHDITVLSVVY